MIMLTLPSAHRLMNPRELRQALGKSNGGRQQQGSQTGFTTEDLLSWQAHLDSNAMKMGMQKRHMKKVGRMQQAFLAEAQACQKEKADNDAFRQDKTRLSKSLERLGDNL